MITQILLQQTIIMFLLMMLGLLLSRRGMITEQGSRDLSNVLLYAVIPCVILRSYMSEFSMDKLRDMGISAVIAVIAFAASIGVAYLTCGTRHRIENFAVAFGNAGFIGIPLVTAVFGAEAAFYVVSYSTLVNLLQWTYGIVIISGKKETINLKMVFVNPVFISMVIGLILFVTQPTLPSVVTGTIGYIADANTALAMIILGFYLSKVRLRDLFASARLYVVSAVRLLVVPAVSLCARRNHADYADRSGNAGCQQHSYLRAEVRSGLPAGGVVCMPVHHPVRGDAAAGHAGGRAISLLKFQI